MPQFHGRTRRQVASFTILTLTLAAGSAVARSEPVRSPAAAAREARITAQLAALPGAVPTLGDWSNGLPPFDARCTLEGSPSTAADRSLEALAATPAWQARRAEVAKLRAALPEFAVDDHAIFGTPQFVRSTRVFLTDPAPGAAPADVVAQYIHDHAALFEIDALEIPASRTARDYKTDHNGVTHLSFQQQHAGIDLYGCMVKANVMPDGRLINISSSMLPPTGRGIHASPPTITAADAVIAAARAAGVELSSRPAAAATPAGAEERTTWTPLAELRADEPIISERLYFPLTREDIRAAYLVTVPVRGIGHSYDIIVDAADGSLLHRHNRLVSDSTQPVTMRVYTSDGVAPMSPSLPAPAVTQAPLATRQLVTVNPADVLPVNQNGWINDNETDTQGNNVDAHLDLDSNNTADLPRPNGGATRTFDLALDPSQTPQSYQDAAVVQMFYFGNNYHDRLYALGFNEAAGNFQLDNFGRGGIANDRVQADTHDGNGIAPNQNNANFSTGGADGSAARVQMYIFTGPTPDRDGSLDGDIVYHEFSHGLSIRLHAGAGITATQPRGMGEGWSDFFGISLLAEPTDDPLANYTTGGYTTYQLAVATYQTNYYYGIRRFPYSVNLNINPLTFADIDPNQYSVAPAVPISPLVGVALSATASEVHNVGEVWCNMLLEARSALWLRDGFSANQLMMQLTVDGLKLMPDQPTFVQCRDAILQADMVNNANANRIVLWTAFAKRGMGFGALAPASNTTTGVVESYALPFNATFSYPDGRPEQLAPGQPTTFRVRLGADGLSLVSGDVGMTYRMNGGAPVSVALTPTATVDEYSATLPAGSCYDRITYSIRTGTSIGDRTDPATGAFAAQVFTGATTTRFDDFETDTGWTVGPNTATSGVWVRADPVGTPAQPEDDHTPTGTMCWVTGNGTVGGAVGAADIDGGFTTLTSPLLDLSGLTDARVSYSRWYSNGAGGAPYADTFRIDVSTNNGGSWVNAETVGPANSADTNPGWRDASWRFSQLGLVPTSQVRIRFVADDAATGSVVEAAIDDFRVEAIDCIPPITCIGDFNNSGGVSVQDIFDFFAAYFSGNIDADINNSGDISVQDIFDFLAAYFAGC